VLKSPEGSISSMQFCSDGDVQAILETRLFH
jgi:hypothetical protein